MKSLMLIFLLLPACYQKTGFRTENSKVEDISDIAKEIRVPSKMWALLKGEEVASEGHAAPAGPAHGEAPADHGGGGDGGHGGAESGGKESADEGFVFSEVKVILTEKNPGILRDPSLTLSFSRGGGEVDLATYVSEKPGSFFVGFDFPEMEDGDIKKVIFISRARKRKIDNQIFGAGCNQFLDITEKFLTEMKGQGIKANTTRKRHVSLLAGTFIISAQKGKQKYVTQVTFTDSSSPQLLCQGKP
jgi:hypothetical protein